MKICDSNVLFGFWPKRRVCADLETVKKLAREHGLTKMMIVSMKAIFDDFMQGNQETLENCRENDNLLPVVTVNPQRFFEIKETIEEYLSKGIKLFRFFPDYQHWSYSFAPFHRILRQLGEAGATVMLSAKGHSHLECGTITQIGDYATKFGGNYIITDIYYGNMAEAIVVAQDHPNIYLSTNLVNAPDGIELLTRYVGAHKLVYGSQMPLHYIQSSLLPVMQAQISNDDKEKMLFENIMSLIG